MPQECSHREVLGPTVNGNVIGKGEQQSISRTLAALHPAIESYQLDSVERRIRGVNVCSGSGVCRDRAAVTLNRYLRTRDVEVMQVELILLPFGMVFGVLVLAGMAAGAALKIVWWMLKLVLVLCFWWVFLLIGGVALLKAILN